MTVVVRKRVLHQAGLISGSNMAFSLMSLTGNDVASTIEKYISIGKIGFVQNVGYTRRETSISLPERDMKDCLPKIAVARS